MSRIMPRKQISGSRLQRAASRNVYPEFSLGIQALSDAIQRSERPKNERKCGRKLERHVPRDRQQILPELRPAFPSQSPFLFLRKDHHVVQYTGSLIQHQKSEMSSIYKHMEHLVSEKGGNQQIHSRLELKKKKNSTNSQRVKGLCTLKKKKSSHV